jgi:2-dehydropantoate 2-reductase
MSEIWQPRVVVIGAGAMGCLFGGLLAEGGMDVTLVNIWGEHVDAINRDGLRMVGHGGDRMIAVKATTDALSVESCDVVLFQNKAPDNAASVASAKHLFGGDTVAISFQNGLGNEEFIANVVGSANVMGGVTALGATIEGPGVVRNFADMATYIGDMDGGVSERARSIAASFTVHGLRAEPSDDIRRDMWKKLLGNVGLSAASAITNMTSGALMELPATRMIVEAAIDEAVAIGRAVGQDLDDAASRDVLNQLTGAGGTGASKSSACTDVLHRRRTEVDYISGFIARMGVEHGIATPVNMTLAGMLKGIETHFD